MLLAYNIHAVCGFVILKGVQMRYKERKKEKKKKEKEKN